MDNFNTFLKICAENEQKCTIEGIQQLARKWTNEPFDVKFFNNLAWLMAHQRNFSALKYL